MEGSSITKLSFAILAIALTKSLELLITFYLVRVNLLLVIARSISSKFFFVNNNDTKLVEIITKNIPRTS
jgi:hypothetical protein